jgi:hypothetical protein
MKYNKDYSEFLLDLLLEKEGKSKSESVDLPFILSNRLKNILMGFPDNVVCKKLLTAHNTRTDKKMTMVDLDNENYDKFTFANSNKLWDTLKDKGYDLMKYKMSMDSPRFGDTEGGNAFLNDWKILRTSIKIGRFVNKMYPDEFHNTEIEGFVNEIKTKRKILDNKGEDRIKVVEGEDIKKYYHEDRYDTKSFHGSPLGGSCMRDNSCQDYIDFYAKNTGVKLVILMSDREVDKISGRALLWDINEIDGEKVERKFMDRIYYIESDDIGLFHDYAKKNNWLYKENQNMSNNCSIYDPEKEDSEYFILKTTNSFETTETYPYMDTMKWFHIDDGFLTNGEDIKGDYNGDIYFLESTGGYFEDQSGIYVEHYDRSYPEEDLIYCEHGDEYRLHDDAYFIESSGEYATETYFNENMFEYDDEYFFDEDGVWSDYLDKMIPHKYIINVYRDSGYDSMEDVLDNEDESIYDKNEYEIGKRLINYYDNISEESYLFDDTYCGNDFIDVKTSDMEESETIKMNIKWDKDRYFKWKGEYYADVLNLKDIITGQKRIWKDENDL